MRSERVYLGIDIGGSSVKLGLVDACGNVLARRTAPLAAQIGREAGLATMFREIDACLGDAGLPTGGLSGVGVAAPGTLDLAAGVVLEAFNLPGWENLPLKRLVADRLQAPAVLVNDANAAAYGEFWIGAGREYRSLMLWTLGTGIGGGIVLDGELLIGAHGHAAECGHMIIQCDGGLRSEHGIHGALELYAGGRGVVRRAAAALQAGRPSVLASRAAAGPLTPRDVAAAAEQGDELALSVIRDTARYLAIGTVNVMHIVNPEIVLLGGAMTFGREESPVGRMFLAEVQSVVRETAFPVPAAQTSIEFASLGNDAGFIGAAGCALRASRTGPLS